MDRTRPTAAGPAGRPPRRSDAAAPSCRSRPPRTRTPSARVSTRRLRRAARAATTAPGALQELHGPDRGGGAREHRAPVHRAFHLVRSTLSWPAARALSAGPRPSRPRRWQPALAPRPRRYSHRPTGSRPAPTVPPGEPQTRPKRGMRSKASRPPKQTAAPRSPAAHQAGAASSCPQLGDRRLRLGAGRRSRGVDAYVCVRGRRRAQRENRGHCDQQPLDRFDEHDLLLYYLVDT